MENTLKENIRKTGNESAKSIKKLLRQRWLVVVIALLLTGLGASLTSVSFKTGIYFFNNWRLDLLNKFSPFLVLPLFGLVGGGVSGFLIKNFSPASKAVSYTHLTLPTTPYV